MFLFADFQTGVFVAGTFLLTALFVGGLLALIVRVSTFRCPACRRRLSLTAIRKEGIRCHRCGWQVEARPPA